jgi:cytochrome c2
MKSIVPIKNIGAVLFPVLMVVGLLVSGFVIVTAIQAASSVSPTAAGTTQVASVSQESLAQQGQALFVAKGCIVCHRNDRAISPGAREFTFEGMPNLTNVTTDADYLRRWLRDPKSMKPTTEMPDLNLSDGEIEALVAFLKSS